MIVRKKNGLNLVALLLATLILFALGYTLTDMMVSKHDSVINSIHSSKAYHIAHAGIQYADKYLQELVDWTTATDDMINFGGGSFTLTFSDYNTGPPERINVSSVGALETITRKIDKTFER